MDEEKGVRDLFGAPQVKGILAANKGRHWCLNVVVLMRYSASISLSLAQCMPDTTNGRLRFENMTMYRLGSSSHMTMFILPRSRKRKMAASRRSEESALEKLVGVLRYQTDGARDCLVCVWYGCPDLLTRTWERWLWEGVEWGGGSSLIGKLGVCIIWFHCIVVRGWTRMQT